jgi:hypothetical protein
MQIIHSYSITYVPTLQYFLENRDAISAARILLDSLPLKLQRAAGIVPFAELSEMSRRPFPCYISSSDASGVVASIKK